MKVTVLGMFGPFEGAGGACSGYLIEENGTRLLLDCGNGVLGRLQEHCSYNDLAAVILSHLHVDHISDIFVLRYALENDRRRGWRASALPLYSPAQPEEEFSRLPAGDAFEIHPYRAGDRLQIGPFSISFAPARHFIPACAARVESGNTSFVYSADTGWSDEVIALAAGADLFLCEANLPPGEESEGHLSGLQAGQMAERAGAARLLLTHIYPGIDPDGQRRDAQTAFPGPVEVVKEGATYIV